MARLVKQGFHNAPKRAIVPGKDGWETAVLLTERWLAAKERVDAILEQLTPTLPPQERARAQQLFYGVVRWAGRIDSALEGLMTRPPRTKVLAVLYVTGFEVLDQAKDDVGATARIVHHAVEKAKTVTSAKEAGLINAVARKMAARLAERPATVAAEFSHPEWLVARWEKQFGADATREALTWNQTPAPVYARWRPSADGAAEVAPPEFLAPTKWEGYYEVKAGHWEDVRQLASDGRLYLQDPSTRLCVELLDPQPNETILDACAAPGGKSVMMADIMKTGRIVALDEPGPRLERLKENLNRIPGGVQVALMPADLPTVGPRFFREYNLPETYDAVLLDVPCSNTGVMRHRVDVKWRLQEGDFERHHAQQFAFLRAASRLVRDGGRLVYSTCSIEPSENENVVQRFIKFAKGWKLERHATAYPWIEGHDGAGAFLLRRM